MGAARRWLKDEFECISDACDNCLEVETQRFVIEGEDRIPDATTIVNVYAVQRGTTHPNRYVIMSGDIDSRASDVMMDLYMANLDAMMVYRLDRFGRGGVWGRGKVMSYGLWGAWR